MKTGAMKSAIATTKTKGAQSWPERTWKPFTKKDMSPCIYHDSAANLTNSVFYSNRVIASGPIAISKQKHPVMWPIP